MSNHISEELPLLLTGEAGRDSVLEAAQHLRSCPDCQQELVSAVVAHASLTSAHRFAPEIVASGQHAADDADEQPSTEQLPSLSSMFAQVRQEAEDASKPTMIHRGLRHKRALSIAAAVVVLGGGGTAIAAAATRDSGPAMRTVALAAYDTGSHRASATIIGDTAVKIDATTLPRLNSDHFYEVWLTDSTRAHMQPLGAIGNDNSATLPVKSNLLSEYSDIEVSVQRNKQIAYSHVSVLRGSYG